jgi:insulysin
LCFPVRTALLEFHARYYSANAMTLAVYGRESLDELEAMVAGLFGALPDKQRTLDVCETPPFLPDAFQVRARVVEMRSAVEHTKIDKSF